MDAPLRPGEVTHDAPGIEQVAFQVVAENLGGGPVRRPQDVVRADVEQVDVGGLGAEAPLVQVFTVLGENLHAIVRTIVDKYPPGLHVDRHAVDVVHVAGSGLVGRVARLAPGHEVVAVAVELHHPRVRVAVGHEKHIVQEGHERRPEEVLTVVAALVGNAQGLDEFRAVIGELEDRMTKIVHHPDVFLRIVGIDGHVVGPAEQ